MNSYEDHPDPRTFEVPAAHLAVGDRQVWNEIKANGEIAYGFRNAPGRCAKRSAR